MSAAARQIVGCLDSIAWQLHAGLLVGEDCVKLLDLCNGVPQQLSAGQRQAVTSSLLSLTDVLVAADWEVADQTGGYNTFIPVASCEAVAACCQLGISLRLDGSQAAQVCRTAPLVLGFGRRVLRRLSGQPSAAAHAFRIITAQDMAIVRLRELAVSGGILPEFAGRLAPIRDMVQWLTATTHLMERLLRSTAGAGELHQDRFGALHNYCAVLRDLQSDDELAHVPSQLLRTADNAAAATQLLLHGLAAGTAALRDGDARGWHLLKTSLSVLHQMCSDGSTAARTVGSSLRGSGDEAPRPLPQLLAEVAAAFPRHVFCESFRPALDGCLSASNLLAALYAHKARSRAAGDRAAVLLPADWDALASCAGKLAPVLQQAAAAAAQLGDSEAVLHCSTAAESLVMSLYLCVPTAFSSPRELARWCEPVSASWRLLAVVAATPQLMEEKPCNAVLTTFALSRCFEKAASACLPPLPGPASSGRSGGRRSAGSPAWDAPLQLLLQLSRQMCRAAHSLAKGGCAPPVAAALVQAHMPRFIGSFLQLPLRLLDAESSLSFEGRQQALLAIAVASSALEALDPAAGAQASCCVCGTAWTWLSQPNSLSNDPAVAWQLTRFGALVLERWLQGPYSTGHATPPKTADVLRDTMTLAATRPRLAAAFLGHPALPALLERCAAEGGQGVTGIALRLHSLFADLASQAAESGGAEEQGQGSGPPELQAAAANLNSLLASLPSTGDSNAQGSGSRNAEGSSAAEGDSDAEGSSGSGNSAEGSTGADCGSGSGSEDNAVQQLRSLARPALLQQAAALAAALAEQSAPSEEQQAADALVMARALAAGHGCNNLACPDWMGEADKLKLCAGCRTARYCSTRCQREGWQLGGHKQCCATLAAEQARQRG